MGGVRGSNALLLWPLLLFAACIWSSVLWQSGKLSCSLVLCPHCAASDRVRSSRLFAVFSLPLAGSSRGGSFRDGDDRLSDQRCTALSQDHYNQCNLDWPLDTSHWNDRLDHRKWSRAHSVCSKRTAQRGVSGHGGRFLEGGRARALLAVIG